MTARVDAMTAAMVDIVGEQEARGVALEVLDRLEGEGWRLVLEGSVEAPEQVEAPPVE